MKKPSKKKLDELVAKHNSGAKLTKEEIVLYGVYVMHMDEMDARFMAGGAKGMITRKGIKRIV